MVWVQVRLTNSTSSCSHQWQGKGTTRGALWQRWVQAIACGALCKSAQCSHLAKPLLLFSSHHNYIAKVPRPGEGDRICAVCKCTGCILDNAELTGAAWQALTFSSSKWITHERRTEQLSPCRESGRKHLLGLALERCHHLSINLPIYVFNKYLLSIFWCATLCPELHIMTKNKTEWPQHCC